MIKGGNFAGMLDALKNIGVQSIELCSALDYEDFTSLSDGKQVRKLIADHGMTCESAHFGMDELRSANPSRSRGPTTSASRKW